MENKTNLKKEGFTVGCADWDTGRWRVVGRFHTEEEKNNFLDEIRKPNSGWLDEELATVSVVEDYNYMLPF